MKYEPTGREWPAPVEPETTGFVADADGTLWQRCRDEGWYAVDGYRHAGMPRVGVLWAEVLGYGPLRELTPPEYDWTPTSST